MTSYRVAFVAAALFCGVLSGAATAQDLPPGDGHDVVQNACTMCHGADVIVARGRSADEWTQVVSQMVGNGANLSDEQFAVVVKYLSTNLGLAANAPAATPAAQPAPAAPASPAAH